MVVQQRFLLGKLFVTSDLVVETGLHIGGGGENLDIGGLDKPVIRDPITRYPYIPGSSVKGKLRSILERLENKPINRGGGSGTFRYESDDLEDGYTESSQNPQPIKFVGARNCPVSRIFGSTGSNCWVKESVVNAQMIEPVNSPRKSRNDLGSDENFIFVKGRNSPARLIVRDCHLLDDAIVKLEKVDTGLYMTEWKFENGIDRITAAANPRQVERVPKGARFRSEIVYTIESESESATDISKALADAQTDLRNLLRAILVLEDDALGGHGTRGYGKIKFENLEFLYKDYKNSGLSQSTELNLPSCTKFQDPIKDTTKLSEQFSEIQKLLPTSEGVS